jgi:hypothetical protein
VKAIVRAQYGPPNVLRFAGKYKLLFKQMEEFARNKGLRYTDQFDLGLLDQFRASWKDGPLSASKKIERLRSVFKFGVKRGFVEKNIAEDMRRNT